MIDSGKVRGIRELFAALDHIPKALPRQVIMPALRVGARVLRDAIRAEVDRLDISDRGKMSLKRSIFIKPMRSRQNPDLVKIGIFFRAGERKKDAAGRWLRKWDGAYWVFWLEYGTAERKRAVSRLRAVKTMAPTGRMPEQPFMRPAIERALPAAEKAMHDELDRRWREVIAQLARGA